MTHAAVTEVSPGGGGFGRKVVQAEPGCPEVREDGTRKGPLSRIRTLCSIRGSGVEARGRSVELLHPEGRRLLALHPGSSGHVAYFLFLALVLSSVNGGDTSTCFIVLTCDGYVRSLQSCLAHRNAMCCLVQAELE